MGTLNLNRKRIFNFALGQAINIPSFSVKFLGAPSNIIGLVLDPLQNQNYGNGSINIYEGGINGPLKTFLSDPFDWYDGSGNPVTNTYSIPANSIIVFPAVPVATLYRLVDPAQNYVGYFEKYNQGKTTINKQNLGSGKINSINLKQYAPIINSVTLNVDGDSRYPNVSFSPVPIEIRQYIIGYQVDIFFTQVYIEGEFQEFGILNPSDSPILSTSFPTNQTTSPIIGGNLESLGATDPTFNFKIRMRGISSNSYTAWSNIVTYGTYIPH